MSFALLNKINQIPRLGFIFFLIPAIIYTLPSIFSIVHPYSSDKLLKYFVLSILNAVSFTSYNLASTSILQRLSVVQHAALNSLRRVFAIVVTSLFFVVALTLTKVIGIIISVGGFVCFSVLRRRRTRSNIGAKKFTGLLPSVVEGLDN